MCLLLTCQTFKEQNLHQHHLQQNRFKAKMVSSINPSLFANSSPNLTTDGIASSAIRIIADTRARLGVSCSPLFIVACPIGVAATSQDLSKNKLANYKLKICILSTYLNSSQISLLS